MIESINEKERKQKEIQTSFKKKKKKLWTKSWNKRKGEIK